MAPYEISEQCKNTSLNQAGEDISTCIKTSKEEIDPSCSS